MTEGEMFAALCGAQCTALLIFFVGVWCRGPILASEERATRLAAAIGVSAFFFYPAIHHFWHP
jgi:hypothetical protein